MNVLKHFAGYVPFYPRERGIILTALAKNGGVNAPLLSSPSQS